MKIKKILIIIIIILLLINISRQINNYAVDFIENKKERTNDLIIGAEPYKIEKDPETTVLLIHGITSSPKDFRNIANYLTSKNISVNAILLPGHGTHPKYLKTIKYQSWISKVNNELNKIKSKNKFILGYSLGGTLTLDLAEEESLNGIILIHAPIYLQSRYVPFIPLVKVVQNYQVKKPESIVLTINEDRVGYDAIPFNAIQELLKLIDQLKLNKVTEPTLIIQTKNDTIVNPESAPHIFNQISSKDKKLILLETSTHEKPYEQEQKEIFEEIYQFIKTNSLKP